MNILRSFVVVMLGTVLFASCKNENKAEVEVKEVTTQTSTNEMAGTVEKTTFQIEGMTCAIGCAKLIEGKLAGLDGVKSAHVDFDTKTAVVEFDDAKQDVTSLVKTVEKIANGIYQVDKANISSVK
ncbi:cation transporter [Myroides sp. M-43]|uniref:heavy-metal-associated domain-containing protein n=1 Tax=Myroides oncorhynchi TaxID=2893756 RepID=UPI001E401C93|nr:heavy-metal-associated domain-containing protein [Myroides oncorhynchi]MCC9042620.1 cation transporter [Myroides oncorhynchi]